MDKKDPVELEWALRNEMADLLRSEAGAESNPEVAKRLRQLAAQFETGATGEEWRRRRKQRDLKDKKDKDMDQA